MTARIISGASISGELLRSYRGRSQFIAMSGTAPHLAVVPVGDDPTSHVFVRVRERTAAEGHIRSTKYVLSDDASEDLIIDLIGNLAEGRHK